MENSHSAFSMPERLSHNRQLQQQQQQTQFAPLSGAIQSPRTRAAYVGFQNQNGDHINDIGNASVGHFQRNHNSNFHAQNLGDNNWSGLPNTNNRNGLPNGGSNYLHASSNQSGLLSSFGSSTSVSAATAIANIASLINSTTSNNTPPSNNPNIQSPAMSKSSNSNVTRTSAYIAPTNSNEMNGSLQMVQNSSMPMTNGHDPRLTDNGIGTKALRAQSLTAEQAVILQRELEQERNMRAQLQQRVLELNQRIHSQLLVEKSYEDLVQKYKTLLSQLQQQSMVIERYKSLLKQMETEKRMLYAENVSLKAQENVAQDKTMLYNILMDRSKKLEEENSSLVLENETYQRQYEKCIDEISTQVVQSLLTQKALQEQCLQLQERLGDLERESSECSDTAVRQARQASSDSRLGWSYRSARNRNHAASPSADSVRSMPAQHHYWRQGSATSLEHQNPADRDSVKSDRIPEHTSPAPWSEVISEDQQAKSQSDTRNSHNSVSIETEFPANNGSPKSTRRSMERAPSSGSLDSAYHSKGFIKHSGKDVRCQRSASAEALRDLKVTMRPKHDLTLPKSFTTPVTTKDSAAAMAAGLHTVTADVHNDLSPTSTIDQSNMTDSGVANDPFADDFDDILSKHQSLIVGSTEDLFGASSAEYSANVRRNVIEEELDLSISGGGVSRGGVAPTPPPRPRSRCLSDCSLIDESKSSYLSSQLTEPSYHSSIDLTSTSDPTAPPPLPPKQYKGSRRPYKPLPAEPHTQPLTTYKEEEDSASDKNTDSESIKQEINALTSQISRMASSHR